jgi:cyclopropane fatty-acyl-phospholipid synthase-like methyltransferase
MRTSASNKVAEFESHVSDPVARMRDHEKVVNEYYGLVNEACQSFWGATHHFAVYTGEEESLAEAAENTERIIVERGGFRSGTRLLDIGCGVGGPAFTVARSSGAHVTGVDMVPSRVEAARTGAQERGVTDLTAFEVGDAMRLRHPDGHFDGAYSIEALCHVPDKRKAHMEAARVLRDGGVWLGFDWIMRDGVSADAAERYAEPICRLHGLSHLSTLGELGDDLRAAGFEVEELCDASELGDLERNWSELEQFTRAVPQERLPTRLRLLVRGAEAILAGARAQVFSIGFWSARVSR